MIELELNSTNIALATKANYEGITYNVMPLNQAGYNSKLIGYLITLEPSCKGGDEDTEAIYYDSYVGKFDTLGKLLTGEIILKHKA